TVWKLQKRFALGKEKKMNNATKAFDEFIHNCLSRIQDRVGMVHDKETALRLYPPVALEHKAPLKADVLSSGHVIDASTRIIMCFYSLGRTEDIWGDDCMEFKPERWFTKDGGIKHEPSYKFTAFHAGRRTCLGKEMGLIQIKMVADLIISRYRVELVEGHKIFAPICFRDKEKCFSLWSWKINLRGRSKSDLELLTSYLQGVELRVGVEDGLLWSLDQHSFSIKKLASLIDSNILQDHCLGSKSHTWNSLVPKKSEFAILLSGLYGDGGIRFSMRPLRIRPSSFELTPFPLSNLAICCGSNQNSKIKVDWKY
nr:alkane hydroxylase MAH1-like [Tanacetum cinerariifolium]